MTTVVQNNTAANWQKVWPPVLTALIVASALGLFELFLQMPAEQAKLDTMDRKLDTVVETVQVLKKDVAELQKVSTTVAALSVQMNEFEDVRDEVRRLILRIGDMHDRIEKIRDDRYTDDDADADLALIRQELKEVFRMTISNEKTIIERTGFMQMVRDRLARLEVQLEYIEKNAEPQTGPER